MLAYQNQPLKEFNKTFLRDIPKESYEACKEQNACPLCPQSRAFLLGDRRVRQGVTAWETGKFGTLRVSCCSPPYKPEFSDEDNKAIIDAIDAANPDLLWIGMTAPKQEKVDVLSIGMS